MPFKDKQKRYEAVRKSVAKKPEKYKALGLKANRSRCQRGYHIKRRYGITMEEYNTILVRQDNGCALCGKQASTTITGRCNLHVDHDHKSGKVRGLLCARCNTILGFLDQPNIKEVLAKAEVYRAQNS